MINGKYPLYRASNLRALNRVILEDEFDDAAKAEHVGCILADAYVEFVQRNAFPSGNWLDMGCGSGGIFDVLTRITHALDANPMRAARAAAKGSVEVANGASECTPFADRSFMTVTYLHGFFQVRSDYEALMEVNRMLDMGGRFIFDLPNIARTNLEFGRLIEPRSYVRNILEDFGFELVERRLLNDWDEAICVEKVADFDYRKLKKLQLVWVNTTDDADAKAMYIANNLDPNDYTVR
jgi:SAM-dependent methyltransferase